MYFNYHATAKKLINDKKLDCWYITDKYKNISPALVLIFNDYKHHIMPIKKDHWGEYETLIDESLRIDAKDIHN